MYSNEFRIANGFQPSVNLEYDLNNPLKIDEYIPTTDICDVLRIYVKAALYGGEYRATTLIGPYGKGKSFLLLVLSYIFGEREKDSTYSTFLERVKHVDPELHELIYKIDKAKIKLLPVIINANYESLSQSFMLALKDALERNDIEDIIPENVYSVCVSLIEKWENYSKQKRNEIDECLEKYRIDLTTLKRGLGNCSPVAYQQFSQVYNCITTGLEFNPLVNNDVRRTYEAVNKELEKFGYTGMFIIFDEFSKFIEGAGESLSQEMKLIQSVAELATRTGKEQQIHLCCVTHKELELYFKDPQKRDAMKTVEGRFKNIKFNRSLDENYQIISAAIHKSDKAKKIAAEYIQRHDDFYSEISSSQPFGHMTDKDELIRGCFPLNPMTVYVLIQLSEIIAQNERTLFTFISDSDSNSFNSFLRTHKEGLQNIDAIFDYFSPLMQKEQSNSIRNIWYRASGTLANLDDTLSRKVVKALAVILMINDNDRLAPTAENIALSVMEDKESVSNIIESMISDHYLRRSVINNLLSFASKNNKEIEEQIEIVSRTKLKNITIDSIADEVNDERYVLPHRYNAENMITRFYRVVFLDEEKFIALNSFELLKNAEFCDGVIINLLRREIHVDSVRDKVISINDPAVLVRYPKKPIDTYFDVEAKRYAALKELVSRGGNDTTVAAELELMRDEAEEDLRSLLDKYFDSNCGFVSGMSNNTKFSEAISEVMENRYTFHTYFNNELINKNDVSNQYQKFTNRVIEWVLSGGEEENFGYSESSAEASVKNALVTIAEKNDKMKEHCSNVRLILDDIKSEIMKADKEKLNVGELVAKYQNVPYGIRKGIIPMLFARAIAELSDNVILYLQKQEIDLNAENLVKSVMSSSGKYYFGFTKGSRQQAEYLYAMLEATNASYSGTFRDDVKVLNDEFHRFFMGLPMLIRTSGKDNRLGIPNEIINYKNCYMGFSTNPYEMVFENSKKVFGVDSYVEIQKLLSDFIENWNDYLDEYKKEILNRIKHIFGIEKTSSVKMGIQEFLESCGVKENSHPMLNDSDSVVFSSFDHLSYDDLDACNALAKVCVGSYIDDWSSDRIDELLHRLENLKKNLSEVEKIEVNSISIKDMLDKSAAIEISGIGSLMKNSIESAFEEYGDSVSKEEKIAILSNMLKELL